MEVVASLSQGRTAAAQCGVFTHKSVPVIFEPPCITFPPTPSIPKIFLCFRVSYESLYSFSFSPMLVKLLIQSNKIYLTQQVDDEDRKAYSSQSEASE